MNKIQIKIPQLKISLTSQQKIILAVLIIIAAFLVFWFLIYSPQKDSILFIKAQALSLEEQTRRIEEITTVAKTIEGSKETLKRKIEELNAKFSQVSEEASLKMLSDYARGFGIKVTSLDARPKKAFLDEDNKRVELRGLPCQVVGVSLTMEGFYINLVKYLEALDKDLPVFWIIQGVKINRNNPHSPLLNINLEVNLYLAS